MKTVFTREEREALNLLIEGVANIAARSGTMLAAAALRQDIASFLDRYTEEPIPDHILATARYYVSRYEEWDEAYCDKYWTSAEALFGTDWQRALDEVRKS